MLELSIQIWRLELFFFFLKSGEFGQFFPWKIQWNFVEVEIIFFEVKIWRKFTTLKYIAPNLMERATKEAHLLINLGTSCYANKLGSKRTHFLFFSCLVTIHLYWPFSLEILYVFWTPILLFFNFVIQLNY